MSWPEALAFIAAMGVVAWALWLRHRTIAKAMENGYEEESRYALPSIPDHRPLWTQTTRPKDPPPAKVGQGGSWKSGTGPNVAGPPDRPKPPTVPMGQGGKKPKVPLGNGRMIPM